MTNHGKDPSTQKKPVSNGNTALFPVYPQSSEIGLSTSRMDQRS